MVTGFFERGVVLEAAARDATDFALAAFAGFLTASFFPLAALPLAFFEATLETATFAIEVDDAVFPFSDFLDTLEVSEAATDLRAGTPFSHCASCLPFRGDETQVLQTCARREGRQMTGGYFVRVFERLAEVLLFHF